MVTGDNSQVVPMENVCMAEEPRILCVIRDMIDPQTAGTKMSINLPASTSIGDVIDEIAKTTKYIASSINIKYNKQVSCELEEISLYGCAEQKLSDICMVGSRRHEFVVTEKEDTLPQRTPDIPPAPDPPSYDSVASTSSPYISTAANEAVSTYPDSGYTYASIVLKSETGYVGLVNQAMTCYLNSLIQTLYMTPEFRNALYRWEFDGSEDEAIKSIPYQLQKLFLQLQTSKKRAVETTDLTRSFGWDSSEVWQQHDVQELCRVMFDALESKWRNTDQSHLINHLYQGKMKDYVKCLECKNESARLDSYLDIPLVIRPFGSQKTYGSVEEAIDAFVQPEILQDINQYFCEKCNKKCDAHKGFKFVSFPYLLTLQLKRFDFDYNTMHRIKLNERMTFPDFLNLNNLVETSDNGTKCTTEKVLQEPAEDSSDEGIDEGIEVENCVSGASSGSDSSSLLNEAAANTRNAKELKKQGPFVYELFSIMIHSGSAAGGHYYAYIKSFSDGHWYSFNDQHVSKITHDEITKTYGGSTGSRGYYSATYTSSTNAYMLMYRHIEKQNSDFIQSDDFPAHIKQHLQMMKDREESERRQRELDKSLCKIKLFCYHPRKKRQLEQKLEIHKDKTLLETTEIVYKMFELENIVPLDCCRIVKYDEYHDSLECSYEGHEEETMGHLLGGVKQAYNFDLLLETKYPDQEFQEYRPGGVTVKVYVADIVNDIIHEPISVRAYQTQSVTEFKKLVSNRLKCQECQMRCVLERFHSDLRFLAVPNKTLKAEGFFKSNKVYIEYSGLEGVESAKFPGSRFYKLLDRHQNTIRIYVNIPSVDDVNEYMKSSSRHNKLIEEMCSSGKSIQDSNSLDVDEGISDRGSDSEVDSKFKSVILNNSNNDVSLGQCTSSVETGSSGRTSSPVGQSSSDMNNSAEFSPSTNCSVNDKSVGDNYNTEDIIREPVEHCDSDSEQTAPPSPGDRGINDMDTHSGQDSSENCNTENEKESDCWDKVITKEIESLNTDAKKEIENWDADEVTIVPEDTCKHFFQVVNKEEEMKQRSLTILVDKRITLGAFKAELEPYIGTDSEHFKVYRVYTKNQEFESIRLSETLSFFEDGKLNIKLGRALKQGEYRVKVFQLDINDPEPSKFLIDTIFAKGMTVLESKKLIIPEIKEQGGLDIPIDRCRLRKKTWKNPGSIYLDNQVYEDDVPIFANWEVFLQILDGEEQMMSSSQLAIFVRQWHPAMIELDNFQEIFLTQQTVEELKEKISEVSGIPEDNIDYAKGRGNFPCDVSLLEMNTDLDWSPHASTLNTWPLYICDDGSVLFYRDKTEKLMELSDEQKKELQQKENIRLNRGTARTMYSPRKEKALKIYTDDHPINNKSSPDLD